MTNPFTRFRRWWSNRHNFPPTAIHLFECKTVYMSEYEVLRAMVNNRWVTDRQMYSYGFMPSMEKRLKNFREHLERKYGKVVNRITATYLPESDSVEISFKVIL